MKQALQCAGVDVDRSARPCHGGGRSPLWLAASRDHGEVVEALLADGRSDVNLRDERGAATPLMAAVVNVRTDVAKLLLRCPRVDLGVRSGSGATAREEAAKRGNYELVKSMDRRDELLKQGRTCEPAPSPTL